jgi:4'-phosphopantetheinyl transferase
MRMHTAVPLKSHGAHGGSTVVMWWLARGEAALPAHARWLTSAEVARADAARYNKRRTEFLLRRLAVKSAVAAAADLPHGEAALARVEVRNAEGGAPYALVDGAAGRFEVSVTDRAGWAVCLVAERSTGPVGCDLELVEPRSAAFLADFLTDAERGYVASRPGDQARHAAANLVWSAKESALKALRTGLDRDTRDVEVTVQDGPDGQWTPLRVRVAGGQVLAGWWRRDGRFLLTVATIGEMVAAPAAIEDPSVLAAAVPAHTWLDRPLR